jgi:choline monooxygenase
VQIADALHARDAFEGSNAGAFYWFLFPNTTFNFYPWGLSINRILPVAIDRTRIVYQQWVLDPSRRASGAGGALDEVEREDDEIVEQVQRGIRSRLYSRGRYSPKRENGVHHFHRMLARLLEPSEPSSSSQS